MAKEKNKTSVGSLHTSSVWLEYQLRNLMNTQLTYADAYTRTIGGLADLIARCKCETAKAQLQLARSIILKNAKDES